MNRPFDKLRDLNIRPLSLSKRRPQLYDVFNTFIITHRRLRCPDSRRELACQWRYQRGHPRQVVATHHRPNYCGLRYLFARDDRKCVFMRQRKSRLSHRQYHWKQYDEHPSYPWREFTHLAHRREPCLHSSRHTRWFCRYTCHHLDGQLFVHGASTYHQLD